VIYRCPHGCADEFHKPKSWKTERGLAKHLREFHSIWVKPEEPPLEYFGDCADCGSSIFKGDTIWWIPKRLICIGCYKPYCDAGTGHQEPAGLEIPYITLEG
jgi:hypothetical protein